METTIPAPVRELRAAVLHAVGGWAIALFVLAAASWLSNEHVAVATQIVAAPVVFAPVATAYFERPHPLTPVQAAFVFAVVAALADLVVVLLLPWDAFAGLHDGARELLVSGIVIATTWLAGVAATSGERGTVRGTSSR